MAEAHGLFLYKRDVGSFGGWLKNRLRMSADTAANLTKVHKRFGNKSSEIFGTLPRSILYLIAPDSERLGDSTASTMHDARSTGRASPD